MAVDALEELESRLQVRLPPSYRDLMLLWPRWEARAEPQAPLFKPSEVAWLRDTGFADSFSDYYPPAVDTDGEIRREYEDLLLIGGGDFLASGRHLFLNPLITVADEWEAWDHAHWHPGEWRYPSFGELLAHLMTS